MPRSLWKKTKQYVLENFREEDPEEYYKYKSKLLCGLTQEEYEFMQAVKSHSIQKIRSLLDKGVDPNFFKNSLTRSTPLHLASEDPASEKIVAVLLFFGANANAQDSVGCTPLHLACLNGNAATVELLLQAGADVNIKDNYEETPLLTACKVNRRNTCEIVDKLLEAGALVSCTNSQKQSVLHMLTIPHHFPTRTEVWMVEDKFALMKKLLDSKCRHLLVNKMLSHGLCASLVDFNGINPLSYELMLLLLAPGNEPDTDPSKLLTAKALLAGGALLQIQEVMEEIDSILSHGTLHPRFHAPDFNNLAGFIQEVHTIIPRQKLQLFLDLLGKMRSDADTRNLQATLESSLRNVPSLLQMSKLCLRQCLGSYVLSQTELLPLPSKMKDFICSV